MGTRRKRIAEDIIQHNENENENENEREDTSGYEQIRQQRIRENKERMHNLGLLGLSLELKHHQKEKPPPEKKRKTTIDDAALPPQRRSSRLLTLEPVNYSDSLPREKHDPSSKEEKEVEIYIPEGTNPEVYSEEQEKMLGNCETVWELFVDGYDEDGNRIYDPIKGETCHQCRQKTLGQHTICNKCELPQGQLCGDCLYMRYGENVTETNANSQWTCPACRGICNCSCCRRGNGWRPTGNIYRKIKEIDPKLQVEPEDILTRSNELEGVVKSDNENAPTKTNSFTRNQEQPLVSDESLEEAVPHKLVEIQKMESSKDNAQKARKDKHQSLEMLKVRASLEEKLKQKGLYSSVAPKPSSTRKRSRPVNGQLETYDDVAVDVKGDARLVNGSSKVSQFLNANLKRPKVLNLRFLQE